MIRIAEFSRSENNADTGTGKPGNQLITAAKARSEYRFVSELSIRDLTANFSVCYRALDAQAAESIAQSAEDTCRNINVGYSWGADRLTFWDQLCAVGMRPAAIKTPCNGDCSAGVAAWVNCAGIKIAPNMNTRIEDPILMDSGQFMKIEGELVRPYYLRRGDILWRTGHTVVVLDDYERDIQAPLIVRGKSHLRKQPTTSGNTATGNTVKLGEIVWVQPGAVRQWAIVTGTYRAWVSTKYLSPLYPVVTTGKVRVRELPSLNAETLNIMDPEEILIGTGAKQIDDRGVFWYEVLTPDRMAGGWISSKLSYMENYNEV